MVKRYIENSVNPRAYTGERLIAADFGRGGEMIGEAVKGLGGAINKVAGDVDDILLKHDEAAVRTADAEDALKISQIKARALAAKGIDAQTAIEGANKEIEELGRQRQTSFSSNRQRQMYGDIFSKRRLGVQERFGEHGVQQAEVARQASLDATIESSSAVAIDNYDDPAEFDSNVADVMQAISEKNRGMPPGAIKNVQDKVRSSIRSSVVERLLADPETASDAAIYLKDHGADILPDDETKLWKAVNPILEEERTLGDAAWAMSGSGIPDGSDIDLPEDPAADPLAALPDDQKIKTASPPPTKGFLNPLGRGVGKITSGFGKRSAPLAGASTDHGGVDIAAPAGTPIRPPMSGKVIRSWFDTKGGHQIMVQHPNGFVTGYAHMKAPSALEAGDPVDNSTIIGSVGSSGNSTGNHLHYTVRTGGEGGAKVDPTKVEWNGGKAVDPGSVNWKEAALPLYNAEDTNLETALGRLHQRATAENWSARRYDKAAAEIRQQGAVRQSLYNQNQARALDDAAAAIADADYEGKPLTQRAQVPGYAQLDAAGKTRIDAALAANKKAIAEGGVKANGGTFLDLLEASATDPETFKAIDIRTTPGITPGEKARLIGMQSKMTAKDGSPTTYATSHSRIWTAMGRYASITPGADARLGFNTTGTGGLNDVDRKNKQVLFNTITRKVEERQQQEKRDLTDDEITAIIKRETVAVVRGGRTMPLYVAERTKKEPGESDHVEIPADKRAQIIRNYQLTHGGAMPSGREVVARYLRWLGKNGS
jgi:murein DD-endopeptidase MepM/ murein hydrolase activator NlpD